MSFAGYKTYAEYLKSPKWLATLKRALNRARNRCQICASQYKLEVHHNTYKNLGRELAADLVVLCDECHELFHLNQSASILEFRYDRKDVERHQDITIGDRVTYTTVDGKFTSTGTIADLIMNAKGTNRYVFIRDDRLTSDRHVFGPIHASHVKIISRAGRQTAA